MDSNNLCEGISDEKGTHFHFKESSNSQMIRPNYVCFFEFEIVSTLDLYSLNVHQLCSLCKREEIGIRLISRPFGFGEINYNDTDLGQKLFIPRKITFAVPPETARVEFYYKSTDVVEAEED